MKETITEGIFLDISLDLSWFYGAYVPQNVGVRLLVCISPSIRIIDITLLLILPPFKTYTWL